MFVMLLLAVVQENPVAAPEKPVVVVAPKPPKEAQICRPVQDSVSRIGAGRECHTAARWRTMGDSVDGHALDHENHDSRTVQNASPR